MNHLRNLFEVKNVKLKIKNMKFGTKVLKCTFKNLNQEVLGSLQKFAKAQIKRLYVYIIAYIE